jgi:outer membrane receptor protein involved in Fe transport
MPLPRLIIVFPQLLKRALLYGAALVSFAIVAAAAGLDHVRSYDLPGGDAAETLQQFSHVSDVQLFYAVDFVRGVRTHPVIGRFSARAALRLMLQDTGLLPVEDALSGAVTVRRAAPVPVRPTLKEPVLPPPIAPPAAVVSWTQDPVRLGPFEVRVGQSNSYGALDSNSVTAFRIDLDKLPATTSVFTQAFMEDVAATSIQEVLVNYSGTVGADPNNAGAALAMPGDRDGSGGGLGIRGLSAAPPKRDGMEGTRVLYRSAFGYTDNFSAERIELVEGPQSLLYGAVGGGGVVNVVSKRAEFGRTQGLLQTRIDQYGSKRVQADMNEGGERFAVRIAAAADNRRNVRYNLGNDFRGLYAQVALRLGPSTVLRVFGERTSNWGNNSFTPSAADLGNFLPAGDPRRGQDPRYLALTHQLDDLNGVLFNGPLDYEHLSSIAGWWASERIDGRYSGLKLESALARGFSVQLSAIYSETIDDRFVVSKNLVPGAGLPGAGANPFAGAAVRFTPGDNWQSDRTRAARVTLLHEANGRLGRWPVRTQTALGIEGSHQGPAFGSSGIDRLYYQVDENGALVINPANSAEYGRIALGSQYFPLQGSFPFRPAFQPGSTRITVNGHDYALQPRIRQDPARVTSSNPFGLVPNNPTAANPNGFSGQWNRGGETHDRQLFLANYTEWDDGRLTTIAGLSVDRFTTLNTGAGLVIADLPARAYASLQLGASWRLGRVPGLRAYANYSTAELSAGTTRDFVGRTLAVPRAASVWPELGLKYNAPTGRWAAQLSVNPETEVFNETRNVGTELFNAVNPIGINGRFNAGDQWINVDRVARSAELTLTATPTPNWRLRFAATLLDGEITHTVRYPQLYNDQFFTRGDVVTYKDGTPVLVDPLAAGGDKTAALTLGMINDPANPYYASPDPDSGRITRSALIAALTTIDPVHGSAATGVTGLPISAMQYAFGNPHQGEITVVSADDKTTGINECTLNLQNHYAFSAGALRGLAVFTDVRTYFRNRAYYASYFSAGSAGTAVPAARVLYRLPSAPIFGLGISYRLRLSPRTQRLTWTTRLQVENVFDYSRVWVVPGRTNGALLNARLSAQPRTFIWTNTVAW